MIHFPHPTDAHPTSTRTDLEPQLKKANAKFAEYSVKKAAKDPDIMAIMQATK